MSFELLPGLAPWLYAFAALSSVLILVAVVGLGVIALGNRRVRVSRSETVRTYYGRFLLSH